MRIKKEEKSHLLAYFRFCAFCAFCACEKILHAQKSLNCPNNLIYATTDNKHKNVNNGNIHFCNS